MTGGLRHGGLQHEPTAEGARHPIYALEFKEGARPPPIMGEFLSVLADKDDWQKAFWFGSMNSYLHNKMPKDLLKSKPQEV